MIQFLVLIIIIIRILHYFLLFLFPKNDLYAQTWSITLDETLHNLNLSFLHLSNFDASILATHDGIFAENLGLPYGPSVRLTFLEWLAVQEVPFDDKAIETSRDQPPLLLLQLLRLLSRVVQDITFTTK